MTKPGGQSAGKDERAKRLAEQLRANLQKRKAQARARRTGAADERPEGIPAASTKLDESGPDGSGDRGAGAKGSGAKGSGD